jgi:hypothetical protein
MQPAQPTLDWDRECPLPVSRSKSDRARHASATGAQAAAPRRGALTLKYISVLRTFKRLSDHEAASMLGCGLSSINATRASLGEHVTEAPETYDHVVTWPDGRTTRRTRWMLVEEAPCGS